LHEAVIRKVDIREVPVEFVDRTVGESKLGLRDIIEFLSNACWIRFRNSRTFIKFSIVGLSGVVVNLAVFSALLSFGMNKYLASPIAIEVSIITNFLINNYWTFRWRQSADTLQTKGLKFNVVSLLALLVSFSTFLAMSAAFPDLAPQVPQLVGIAPAMLLNYLLNSYWTFKNVESTTENRK
jgi:dolichol-phosphate mannosyltransferase